MLLDSYRSARKGRLERWRYRMRVAEVAAAYKEVLESTVGCVDCKLKFPTRRTSRNMLREMDHSLLPLDTQCHAEEEELGQRIRADHLLLVRSPSNSRSSDPTYKFAGAAQVHRL